MPSLTKSDYQTLIQDIIAIYQQSNEAAQEAFNRIRLIAYWGIGRCILDLALKRNLKEEYQVELLEDLSIHLTEKLGGGFSVRNLWYMRSFYLAFPGVQAPALLSWTHYQILSAIPDQKTRQIYERKTVAQSWSTRDLREALNKDEVPLQRIGLASPESESDAAETTPAPTLTLKRGILYTYKILEEEKFLTDEKPKRFLDLGFDMLLDLDETTLIPEGSSLSGPTVQSEKSGSKFTLKSAEVKSTQLFTYKAQVKKFIDGDTIVCLIDCGLSMFSKQTLRFRGINAPELSTPKGQEVKKFVQEALGQVTFVIVKTYSAEKYDRYLTDIFYLPGEEDPQTVADQGQFLNQELLDAGLVVKM